MHQYMIEGINSKGVLVSKLCSRVFNCTTEQSVELDSMLLGINGAYSWYEV